jgi:hypothetical protein
MKKILLFTSIASLIGCGGGGGGGGSSSNSGGVTPFTSWSAVTPNSTVRVEGSSQEVSYTANASTDQVTSVSAVSANQSGAYIQPTVGPDGRTTALTFGSARGTTATWNTANGDTLTQIVSGPYAGINVAVSSGQGSNVAVAADPFLNGWNYQTFGVWITGRGTGSGTAGALSVGNQTALTSIPQSGTATYIGGAGGTYLAPTGEYFVTAADMTANVNFGNRQINFATTGTVGATPNMIATGTAPVNVAALNLTGQLAYSAGANQFSGSVQTAGGAGGTPLTGTATGNFYGPSAAEIGGTFGLNGSGMETFAGAFGGKR